MVHGTKQNMFSGAECMTFIVKCHFQITKLNIWLFLAVLFFQKWLIFGQGDGGGAGCIWKQTEYILG